MIDSVNYTTGPTYGDALGQDKAERAVRAAQDSQTCQFAVAPGCSVSSPNGIRRAGQEIDLAFVLNDRPTLNELVRARAVIELDPNTVAARQPPSGERTRYRIAPRRGAFMGTGGRPLVTDQWVCAADFGAREAVPPRPATPTLAGHNGSPAETAEQVLAEFVRKGVVIDTQAGQARGKRP